MLRTIFALLGVGETLRPKKPALPSRIRYVTFRVENREAARALYDWHRQWEAASREIRSFIEYKFGTSLMRIDRPSYKLNDDGRLHSVAFNYFVPVGWSGIPGTHWLVPKTGDALAEVRALPCAPPRRDMHGLINWPTLDPDWFHFSERETVRFVNHMPRPFGDDGGTFVAVPHPDNFKDFPRIQEMIRRWEKPDWLTEKTQPAPEKNL